MLDRRKRSKRITCKKLRRVRDDDNNPCILETDASRKCMDDNSYNKDMCTIHFLRYKNCRKFWNGIMMQRRKDGIQPNMPTAEEREKILESIGGMPY
ncbi:coiled-coil-helix-coiled-coil-helix domain-containing protein 7 isoform X2 [Eublepharis macularius]|uniref:Coiled-coil-helix-coiled-coil-helix domain-containing protein 7 n=1 Tax=Eublepharis macularius TaxID=481883 RepID=A0AA97JMH8_EUBMA|nr:coiled-coil-helix-coiled-coil-helix domain-containing protein 7 isoform X2 [Eublepharis macularius]